MLFSTVAAAAVAGLLPSLVAARAEPARVDVKPAHLSRRQTAVGSPFTFTSTYQAFATPEQVVNASNIQTGGDPGSFGSFFYGINTNTETICYNISISLRGGYTYQSPARTATHIHQAPLLTNGPPRIAFPNPVENPNDPSAPFTSVGCLQGPFTTGIINAATGLDTGAGFKLSQIEANPSGFFTDVHTARAPAGAVRGQLLLTDIL